MLTSTSIKWGIFLGVAVCIGTQLLTWMGMGLTNWFVLITFILVILFVILCLRNLKSDAGSLTFPKAALSVLLLILVSRIIFQAYMFVYTNYVDPVWVETVAETWTQSLKEANVSPDKIEQQINSFRTSYQPLQMFTTALLMYAIPQFIIGLITAAVYWFVEKRK